MGLADAGARLSRRLSAKGGALLRKAAASRPERAASAQSEESGVSDVDESRGAALRESNALNEEGLSIISNIARELELRIEAEGHDNEEDPFSKGKIPGISVEDYMCRLSRYVNVWRRHAGGRESAGVRAAVMTIIYLRHLEEMHPDFGLNQKNVHRILMAGYLVAVKWSEDQVMSTDWWAKVSGISQAEVNRLESVFCNMLEFELFIDDVVYDTTLRDFEPESSDVDRDDYEDEP
ncbi:Cyclin-U4-1 [Hondaea fermentalgiana]|uniref:Cyclin-U4-1 n=1 Tax=Hondaea fermentalgiana TaxID=2315210 RepID=A0A2R5GGH7_9STRA|nr:Cyclin-U4-1 [Hondaea fermentalgiana]|eukprot:GBG29987.1 Cyclin-U4-1 [Hondaea fermentalgiana]